MPGSVLTGGNILLPPATKLQQGNVFTPVCQSFCSQEVSATYTPGQTPRADTPWAHAPLGTPPRADTPSAQCMLGYGQQADGTHPTGMHTSDTNIGIIANFVQFLKNSIHAKIMAANTCENAIVKEL